MEDTHFIGFARVLWKDLCKKILSDRLFADYTEEAEEWMDFDHSMRTLSEEAEQIIAQRVDALVSVLEIFREQEQ